MIAAEAEATSGPLLSFVRRGGPLLLLLLATLALGLVGQSVARPLFIVGCAAVAWDLLRFGAPLHLAGCLTLFCLAPFLRRVVDLHAGYEPSGLMISGPLIALLVTGPEVLKRLTGGTGIEPALRPFILTMWCILWGGLLTLVLDGNVQQALSGTLKFGAPTIYGMWLYGEAKRDAAAILDMAARCAMVVVPAMGVYGFMQYVDPPMWDRFWMSYTTIASIGQPEPFMVRVFSTMNAPAGYAVFTVAGLLLFGFRRVGVGLFIAAAPSVLGLMLSMYRTAWIGLAVGMLFGLVHRQTWKRAAVLLAAVPVLVVAVVMFTPAGDALEQRLGTFGSVSDDASGQERLAEYGELLNADGGTLLGHGFGTTDVMQAGSLALDGQFAVAWYDMGLVVGMISVAAVVWAALQGLWSAWRTGSVAGMAVAGIMAASIVQLPLAVVSSSEVGFLFWSFAAIGAGMGAPARKPRPATIEVFTIPPARRLTSR